MCDVLAWLIILNEWERSRRAALRSSSSVARLFKPTEC
jgi:hypothetical protein